MAKPTKKTSPAPAPTTAFAALQFTDGDGGRFSMNEMHRENLPTLLARLVVGTTEHVEAGPLGLVRGLTEHALLLAEAADDLFPETYESPDERRQQDLVSACARVLRVLDEVVQRLDDTAAARPGASGASDDDDEAAE